MTTTSYVLKAFPDVEGAVRAWLRSVPAIADIVEDRVFFSIPDNTAWPLIVITDVGGGPEPGDTPVTRSLLQLDCWGPPSPVGRKPRKAETTALRNVLVGVLESMPGNTDLGGIATGLWAHVLGQPWFVDRESNQARYAVTAEIAATAA